MQVMNDPMSLPPSVVVGPTTVDVSVLTPEGAMVLVALPRPRGLYEIPKGEIVDKARELACVALQAATDVLAH
jgi:hypothetical protein